MQSIKWRIGCSGFHYREWREEFYPKGLPPSKWFDYYAQHFNTLELNVTFYRFPTLKSLQGWSAKAPDDFFFSAKVPRTVTHYQKFTDTENQISDFYAVLKESLKNKLGCVLFQLPPSWSYSEKRLDLMLTQLDLSFRNVIEFRHKSWWRKDVEQALATKNISFCGVSFPTIEYDHAVVNTPFVYYRFHGVPVLFHSAYENDFLDKITDQISEHEGVQEAYLYFNNTASMAAIGNAAYVQSRVATQNK